MGIPKTKDAVSSCPAHDGNKGFGTMPVSMLLDDSVSPSAKLYYTFLSSVSYSHNGLSWYSQATAAKRLKKSRKWVNTQAVELEKAGWIKREWRGRLAYTTVLKQRNNPTHQATDTFNQVRFTDFVEEAKPDIESPSKDVYCNQNDSIIVTKVTQSLSPVGYTIMRVNNEMKENDNVADLKGRRRSEGEGADLSDLADQAGRRAEELHNQRLAKKRYDRKAEALRAHEKKHIDRWRGTKFFQYLLTLCAQHDVPVSDQVALSTGVPPRYGKAMNDVLALVERYNIDNQRFARILESLISQWHEGASQMLSRDGRLSVYMIRARLEEIVNKFDVRETPKVATSVEQLPTLDEVIQREKERDNKEGK
jgi:hypothetical protein